MFLLSKIIILLLTAGTFIFAGSAQAHGRYANSTAYCLKGKMADGTYTRYRSVAMNNLPLGSIIKTSRRGPTGYRIFVVRDRIGHGSQLDFWVPRCEMAYRWGRRTVSYRVLRYGR